MVAGVERTAGRGGVAGRVGVLGGNGEESGGRAVAARGREKRGSGSEGGREWGRASRDGVERRGEPDAAAGSAGGVSDADPGSIDHGGGAESGAVEWQAWSAVGVRRARTGRVEERGSGYQSNGRVVHDDLSDVCGVGGGRSGERSEEGERTNAGDTGPGVGLWGVEVSARGRKGAGGGSGGGGGDVQLPGAIRSGAGGAGVEVGGGAGGTDEK